MRIRMIMLMQLSINCRIDFVVQYRGRRRINHVPAKRDVIGCNNFASWISVKRVHVQYYANNVARVVQVLYGVMLFCFILLQMAKRVYTTRYETRSANYAWKHRHGEPVEMTTE